MKISGVQAVEGVSWGGGGLVGKQSAPLLHLQVSINIYRTCGTVYVKSRFPVH